MNLFERQLNLSRRIFEENMQTMQRINELDTSSFAHQLEANQDFVNSLTNVRDMASFTDLQRRFAEQIWGEYQGAMETRAEIVRENMERIGQIMQDSLQPGDAGQD